MAAPSSSKSGGDSGSPGKKRALDEGPPPSLFTGQLKGLNEHFVLDEAGTAMMVPSLCSVRRILLVFLRHFGCRFCHQQVNAIRQLIQPHLLKHGVKTVLVSIGTPEQIAKFKSQTAFEGEIYVDPMPDAPAAYKGFGLCGGKQRIFNDDGELHWHIQELAEAAAAAGFEDGGYGSGDVPYTGDIFQVGGMFVMDRDACMFAHRSAFPGDLPEVADVLEAATGLKPDGSPTTATWPAWETPCTEMVVPPQPAPAPAMAAPRVAMPRVAEPKASKCTKPPAPRVADSKPPKYRRTQQR